MNIWPIDRVDGQPFRLSRLRERILDEKPEPQNGHHLDSTVGLRFLGSGCYGRVYAINERYVLKLVVDGDMGYEAFVETVRKNPDNPHFPRFRYMGDWEGIQAYIIERLEPLEDFEAVEIVEHGLWHKQPHKNVSGTMWAAIEALINTLNEYGNQIGSDIGYSNMMQREDGTVVITDPFC